MTKELLFTLTKKDFDFQFYRGSGKGGQKRNKTSNCCRCIHIASGSTATSEDGRSQLHNKETAFIKCCETTTFKLWHQSEVFKYTEEYEALKLKHKKELDDIKSGKSILIEVKDAEGNWVPYIEKEELNNDN